MAKDAASSSAPRRSSFLVEAWREFGRKLDRRSLRAKMAQQDAARNAALTTLGQKAWESGINLSEFSELVGQITGVVARSGELASATQTLEGEKSALEEKRRAEVTRFDARRKALDDLKRPVDASFRDASQKQSAQDRETRRMESRLAAIAGELAGIDKQTTTPPAPGQEGQAAALNAKRQQLLTEQSQLSAALPAAKQLLQSLGPEVERLKQESQRLGNEIAKMEAERKAALGQIDASLDRLRGELRSTGQQSAAAGQERSNRFLQLGRGVFEKKQNEPELAGEVQAVQQLEAELAATAGSLRDSVALTNAMPRGTMAKFFVTILGVPLVIVGLIFGGFYLYERTRPEIRVETPKPINRYIQHPLKDHAAYALANQIAEAKSEQEVAEKLKEALKKIHVGIYTPDGRQILAGAERNQNDFFLYDFQVKILARAFYLHNAMPMANHTRMLGKGLLEMEQPSELEPVLNGAIVRRYREAQQQPDDPMSFIVLLMDGLARQQVEPYSLNETHRYERVGVDPIQSFLIMLEFFTRPPAPKLPAPTSLKWVPSLVTTAYAQSSQHPCDGILGDEGQGYWGRGTDAFTEVVGSIPKWGGKAVSFLGDVTGVFGAMGDLLILYGMNITLTPDPYTIHLRNCIDDAELLNIQAIVTFDSQGVHEDILKCGWIVGKQLPSNGPLKDVELKWDFYRNIERHFTMHSDMTSRLIGGHEGLRTLTNVAGASSFMFNSKSCPHPREKVIVGYDYLAKVTARYVTRSVPSPGMPGPGLILKMGPGAIEYLMNGRNAYTRFRAEWHEKVPPPKQYQ